MKYFLGIDQGGTKTAAIICDASGAILGTGSAVGLADVYFKDTDDLYIKRIISASDKAYRMAGITVGQVSAACGALNGADWDFEYQILAERLSKALNIEDVTVLNDCIAGMQGGSSTRCTQNPCQIRTGMRCGFDVAGPGVGR